MRIVISAQGGNLEAPASQVFGRCPTFVFVDTETLAFEADANPAMNQGGGAGIQAAQFVVERGAEAVLTGNLGPNAFDVLRAAGVPGYLVPDGSVGEAVEAYQAGSLQAMGGANVAAHAGMRGRGGMVGRSALQPAPSVETTPVPDREQELAQLRETLMGLRQQLADTMAKIEDMEKES